MKAPRCVDRLSLWTTMQLLGSLDSCWTTRISLSLCPYSAQHAAVAIAAKQQVRSLLIAKLAHVRALLTSIACQLTTHSHVRAHLHAPVLHLRECVRACALVCADLILYDTFDKVRRELQILCSEKKRHNKSACRCRTECLFFIYPQAAAAAAAVVSPGRLPAV